MADKFISLDRLSLIKNWIVGLLGSKQNTLVSGTNLKTVNGQSLLGSGNVVTMQSMYNDYGDNKSMSYYLHGLAMNTNDESLVHHAYFSDEEVVRIGYFDDSMEEELEVYIPTTINVNNALSTKANLVPSAVNGEVLITDAQGQPQSSGTDLATLLNLVPEVKTSGNWKYRVDKNGFFEAWYMQTGYTVTINNQSGTLYRSQQITFTLPTDLVGSKTPTIQYAKPDIAHNNYPVWCGGANFSGSNVLTYALSGGSRSSSPNYTLECYVTGTLS